MHMDPVKVAGMMDWPTPTKCDALSRCADHDIGSDDNCDSTLLQPKFFVIRAPEGMMMGGVEQDMLHEVHKGVQDGRSEDLVVKAMKELEKLKGKVLQSSEWAEQDGLWMLELRYCHQDHKVKGGLERASLKANLIRKAQYVLPRSLSMRYLRCHLSIECEIQSQPRVSWCYLVVDWRQ